MGESALPAKLSGGRVTHQCIQGLSLNIRNESGFPFLVNSVTQAMIQHSK